MNIYRYKSTGQLYEVISENARMKDPNFDRWIDCVIYRPLYDNKYEMFSRWSVEFYDKFIKEEKLEENSIQEEIDRLWHEYYKCCNDCVGNGCDDCRSCEESKKKNEIYNKIQNLKNEN